MASVVESEESYLVSADIGIMKVHLQTVSGYNVEDIIRDKAISQARAVQFLNLGKMIDPTAPSTSRTLPSIWLNNEDALPT
jgi:hypothetical protein